MIRYLKRKHLKEPFEPSAVRDMKRHKKLIWSYAGLGFCHAERSGTEPKHLFHLRW